MGVVIKYKSTADWYYCKTIFSVIGRVPSLLLYTLWFKKPYLCYIFK